MRELRPELRLALGPRVRDQFRHAYSSPDLRGNSAAARAAATAALAALGDPGAPTHPPGADPFMAQDHYLDRTNEHVARDFGPGFATALFRLDAGSWQGPIESGFGWHLVFVESEPLNRLFCDAQRARGMRVRPLCVTKDTFCSLYLTAGGRLEWLAEQTGVAPATLRRHYARYVRTTRDDTARFGVAAARTGSGRFLDAVLSTGMDAGIKGQVGSGRKVTVEVPDALLRKAQESTGAGVTATIRRGLELVAASHAYEELRRLRGKVRFSTEWQKLRADRPIATRR